MTLWISVKDNDFNTIIPCPVPQPEAKRLEYGAGAWNLALKADAETGSLRSAKRVKRLSPSVARTEPSVPHHYDTILEAFTHISMLEENEEGFVSVSGYLTFTGFAQSKIVCATCVQCSRRFSVEGPADGCPSCNEALSMDSHRSKLRFHCPVSLSDATGTWKNVYLSDGLATQESLYLEMTPAERSHHRLGLLFTRFRLTVHLTKGANQQIRNCRLVSMERITD